MLEYLYNQNVLKHMSGRDSNMLKHETETHSQAEYYIKRFVLGTVLQEYVAYKILDPYYLQFMTTERGINLTAAQFGLFVAVSNIASAALDYLTGALADKYGRCRVWAISAFCYGFGMLWLALSPNYYWSLLAAVCMGISYALASGAPQAWIFDQLKGDGLRRAVGRVYQAAVPGTLIGVGIGYALGFLGSMRIPLVVTAVIVIGNGILILTFKDNYDYNGARKSWGNLLRIGFKQFSSRPVLWLTAIQSFFYLLPSWISTAWWLTYLVKTFGVSSQYSMLAFGIVSLLSSAAAGIIGKMKDTSYNKLIIVPTIISMAVYSIIPSVNNSYLYVAMIAITVTAGYFRGAGITVLENNEVDEARATALSFMGSIRSVFWIVGPLLFGNIIDYVGLRSAFFMASAACLVSLILLMVALRHSRKESKDVEKND
ncbi:MAG: MFS transporter [Clostridiales bacterium]|nr:MFS transporter [Clostridiales bacterium]